jgi:hypothetical protein
MICYKDTTYCASPNCQNKCGRKLDNNNVWSNPNNYSLPTAYAYFCDDKGDVIDQRTIRVKECQHEPGDSGISIDTNPPIISVICIKCGEYYRTEEPNNV